MNEIFFFFLQNTLTSLSNRSEQPQTVPITNETMVETKKLWDAVEELRKNLTHINQSLTTNLTWVQEDFAKDHVSSFEKLKLL